MSKISWDELQKKCFSCDKCNLHKTRDSVVFGYGNESSKFLIVDKWPGEQKDINHDPFGDPGGHLLKLALSSSLISLSEYYFTYLIKCRAPIDIRYSSLYAEACLPYLRMQYSLIRPRIVLCLGELPSHYLISPDISLNNDSGKWFNKKGCFFIPTYHPTDLLYDENKKEMFLDVLLKVKEMLERL